MDTQKETESNELPPFFKTWNQLYIFVIVELVVCIAIFYAITIYF
jgi:hypothetical protein